MYSDEVDEEVLEYKHPDYRKIGLDNAESNHGWYTCVKCERSFREGDMDIDHIIPQSKGGDSTRYNLQCICKHCNRSKRDDTSETAQDLARRKEELKRQREEDEKILEITQKMIREEKRK
ncbi:MAG: HNH endonuclease [Lachnospiraceae bacterium]|nr:HNH endonuclease [Lachnospiraceae bacterium]